VKSYGITAGNLFLDELTATELSYGFITDNMSLAAIELHSPFCSLIRYVEIGIHMAECSVIQFKK